MSEITYITKAGKRETTLTYLSDIPEVRKELVCLGCFCITIKYGSKY